MPNIFTRKALNEIMGNEALTPEQRTEQVLGLYGRALDDAPRPLHFPASRFIMLPNQSIGGSREEIQA